MWETSDVGDLHNDRCLEAHSCPTLISMADQASSAAARKSKKKGGGIFKFRDLITTSNKRSKLVSAIGAHDADPGREAGRAEPTAPSKDIDSILVLSTTT